MKNFFVRTISALVLAPLVIYLIYVGGLAFQIMLGLAAGVMFLEWVTLTKTSRFRFLWVIFGIIYINAPLFLIYLLSAFRQNMLGFKAVPIMLLLLVVTVWLVDIGAYIFGRLVGGPKIAPKISPNKTYAGLLGGLIFSLSFFLAQNIFEPFKSLYADDQIFRLSYIAYFFVPFVAQAGDFFESWIKRRYCKKDSGFLIPGHGGLLDRLDGLLATCNVFLLVILVKYIAVKFF